MKKSNFFVNQKRDLEGSFFIIYKHFGDFFKFVANSARK